MEEAELKPTLEQQKAAFVKMADNYAKKLNTQFFVIFKDLASYEVVSEQHFRQFPDDRVLLVHTTEDCTPADQKPRAEHLKACQELAKELLDSGKFGDAWTAFSNAMRQHPGTALHPALKTGLIMLQQGTFKKTKDMRDFIMGFK